MENKKPWLTIFFRHQRNGFFSIEKVFDIVLNYLPSGINYRCHFLKKNSNGFFKLISNSIGSFLHRNKVNHITGDVTYIANLLPGRRTIITFHDLESLERKSRLKSLFLKYFWIILPSRKCEIITVISEHTKKKLLDMTRVNSSKVRVIYDPLPNGLNYLPKEFNKAKPVILVMGTKPNKNLEGVIKAVGTIKCSLLIVGRLSQKQILALAEFGTEYENIYDVAYEKIIDSYIRSDILCFPSFYEGFGLPIIEAQAVGRPVITSNFGAMKEISAESALLVNPLDPHQITEAINKIICNQEFRESLIKAGRKNIERFEGINISLKYAEIYRELLAKQTL